jgi:hypothetical protein
MNADRDLSKKEQKQAAELQAAEKISSEIIPHLFHDAEPKPWVRLFD